MRLIDADRLLSERMKHTYYHLPNGDIAIPLIDIEHAPAIEPETETEEEAYERGYTAGQMAGRKTGHWIQPKGMMPPEHHGHYECSECGAWAGRNWLRPWKEIQLSNYCPNCGIPMTDKEGAQDG